MYTIDIDTGGTFTDGFFTRDGEFKTAKTLTTPHDLTVCLADCIREGAKQFGIAEREMLLNTSIIRYSTTVGVNTLITKTGSKIGLIVTKGFSDLLSSKFKEEMSSIHSLVVPDLIMEIEEEVDENGRIIKPLMKEEIVQKMQQLIDMGVRAITVSLNNSNFNPVHERQVKAIIKEQYPNYFMGSVRVFLGSEMSDEAGNLYRTNAVLMNGYIHDTLVKYLYKAEDDLRAKLYSHPLMLAHSHGGVARIAKSRAIDTYSCGPALGVIGAAEIGKLYEIDNVITVDIGGTSLDLGVVHNGQYRYDLHPQLAGLTVNIPMITTDSIALASGSIASVDRSKTLHIGPKSAGAKPGPACFGLGGMEPTVTDADVVLGFIDPNYFLGGKIKLDLAKGVKAIKTRIADPLNISVEEAAFLIRKDAGERTRNEIVNFVEGQGISVQELSNFAVVVYGGAGPAHYCDFIKNLPFKATLVSPYSAVFSAYGASTTNVVHAYSKSVDIKLHFNGDPFAYASFNDVIDGLMRTAIRDIGGEGFSPENTSYQLEAIATSNEASEIGVETDSIYVKSEADVRNLQSLFLEAGGVSDGGILLSRLTLRATVKMPHLELKQAQLGGEDASKALKGYRDIFWAPESGYTRTPVYQREMLSPGNVIVGPAIVESKDTTCVIPEGDSLRVDEHLNAKIERSKHE